MCNHDSKLYTSVDYLLSVSRPDMPRQVPIKHGVARTFFFHFRSSESETTVLQRTRGDDTILHGYKPKKKNCRGNQKEISLATCHHFSLRKNSGEKFVKLSSQRADGRPRVPRGTQAKFGSQFVKGFQETDLAGHASGERAIRCASRNFLIGRVYLPSPPLETKCLQSPFCDSSAPECLASSGHHEFEPTQL